MINMSTRLFFSDDQKHVNVFGSGSGNTVIGLVVDPTLVVVVVTQV